MLVRRLVAAAAILFVPVAAGCGDGGGKPSTAELSTKIRQEGTGMPEEQATCIAEAMRDILPADALREFMDADLDAEGEPFDDAAMGEVSDEDQGRLMGATFECMDFGDLDLGDFGDVDSEDPGQNPFDN